MKSYMKIAFLLLPIFIITTGLSNAKKSVKAAIVKIYTTCNRHNYYEPWQMIGQNRRNGSGCIIKGNRILTNAHVVGNHTYIQVRRTGQTKKYRAEIETVAHECDLAILKVDDESFFSDVVPIEFGNLPEIRDKVAVYGFPIGGVELSITEGVVSRVEHHKYTHSKAYLLTCQIDAAINRGNSGGPVIKDGKIAGVAFQAGRGENIGYMVPVPVIKHFLTDMEDGKYDGIPGLGISWQKMENPDLRRKFKMNETQSGILVNKIYPDSPAIDQLKTDDIILSIDGINIENDGTVEFRKDERTFFGHLIQKKQLNDSIVFKILRTGEIKNIMTVLSIPINSWRLVPHDRYDTPPCYYITGGLVFEPLTLNFLQEWSDNWQARAPENLVTYYYYGEPTEDRKEVVVLVKVLADEINMGYHDWNYNVITHVNGRKISTMKDLVEAFENHRGRFHIIEDEAGKKIVLDKNKVDKNSQRILQRYKIKSNRSEGLK